MTFDVRKLMFIESGSYHNQAARPYQSTVDDERTIMSLKAATQDGTNISGTSVAGIASSIIRPSTEAGRGINITNGWGERRYRFFMEIEMSIAGNLTRKIIIGYTDHVGVSMAGTLDPSMRMYINNVIVLRQVGLGNWQIHESNHVVVNDIIVHGGGGFNNESVVMRPEDVFNTLQSTSAYPAHAVKVYDFRANIATGARKSSRGNTNHNQYLANSMKALHTAQINANMAEATMPDIYQEATAKVRESSIVDDNILRNWDDHGGYFEEGFITYGLLCDMSPSTSFVTQHFELKTALKQATTYTNDTQHFNGSDVTAIMSTILSNTVPPMAMECLLTKVEFSATNATLNGSVDARITNTPHGFIDNYPLNQFVEMFLDRLVNIIMPDVTNNFQYIVQLDMKVDILGETRINISVNGEPAVPYVIPSFADALMAPIIGNEQNDLRDLASDINVISSNIGAMSEVNSSPIIASGETW